MVQKHGMTATVQTHVVLTMSLRQATSLRNALGPLSGDGNYELYDIVDDIVNEANGNDTTTDV